MPESALKFPSGVSLAPHVIVAHHDVSAAGPRALALLHETLAAQCGSERSSSAAGELYTAPATQSAPAWEIHGAPVAPFVVHTFRGGDGAAVLSLVSISAEVCRSPPAHSSVLTPMWA